MVNRRKTYFILAALVLVIAGGSLIYQNLTDDMPSKVTGRLRRDNCILKGAPCSEAYYIIDSKGKTYELIYGGDYSEFEDNYKVSLDEEVEVKGLVQTMPSHHEDGVPYVFDYTIQVSSLGGVK